MTEPLLRVEDLRTHFFVDAGVVKAVDGVSFEIRRGEVVGLVGESGCGKTVTSLSIAGLIEPPGRIVEGSVRFDGTELVGASERVLNSVRGPRIAMIFQQPRASLDPVMSVGRQIGQALRSGTGMDRSARRRRAVELLDQVGISDPDRRVREYPHQLSGGMAQRVMIAIALAGEPDLLIADEPTTALDVTVQAQILELLKELQSANDMAVILITHDLGVVAEIADRAAVMYAGRIVEECAVSELYDAPLHPYTLGLMASRPAAAQRPSGLVETANTVAESASEAVARGARERSEQERATQHSEARRSMPVRVGAPSKSRLRVIPGSVPVPLDLPVGCSFAPRCAPRVESGLTVCTEQAPDPVSPRNGHHVRCWLHG